MLLFGHIGITLGATTLAHVLARHTRNRGAPMATGKGDINGRRKKESYPGSGWIVSLARFMDIRLLIIGSMLPDIIDKPIGQALFVGTFSNGRIFSHSLFFLAILALIGVLLYRGHRSTGFIAVSAGVAAHLFLDQIWLMPRTFLWPFLGFSFDKLDLSNWTSSMLHSFYTNPETYITEAVGAVIMLWFLAVLFMRKSFVRFVVRGRL